MNPEDYKEAFGTSGRNVIETRRNKIALDHALDIRKFEIGLYWQRAAYFWTLIAVAFAGYFAILSADHLANKFLLSYLVACVGLTFTVAWFQANKGSKYWQENWENHVDMLEDGISGPLYKTVMSRPRHEGRIERWVTGPRPYSVSKINQFVSLYSGLIWVGLVAYSIACADPIVFNFAWMLVFGSVTALSICALFLCVDTHHGDQTHVIRRRQARAVSGARCKLSP